MVIHTLARGTIAKNEPSDGLEAGVHSVCVQKLTNESQGIVDIEEVKNPLQDDLSPQCTI